ncbi:MAG: protein translocase subunit SecF [Candidatus Delongbacteria bacterium]|jgi:preprotein translocase subunit SecF|nr:protein translocase subunit SecF [Candidatus Delongbacteria bacterium]
MSNNRKIDFIGKRKVAAILSISLILIGVLSVVIQKGLNYNIEFNGGYLMHAGFSKSIDIADLRNTIHENDIKGFQLQEFSDNTANAEYETEVIIKVETNDQNLKEIEAKITKALEDKYGRDAYEIRQASSIGPKIGEELKNSAVQAIFWSLLFILIYITIKFQFRYGIAAIIALFHDVAITLGILSILGYLFDYEISLSVIAALLTIVGYSLNDTIVVFSRIRENIKTLEGMDFDKIVNVSINETLTRTLLTSLTTLVVVFVLFLFGGEVIRGLSTTLMIGVIVGTYSSMFVASPVVIAWNNMTKKKRKLKKA